MEDQWTQFSNIEKSFDEALKNVVKRMDVLEGDDFKSVLDEYHEWILYQYWDVDVSWNEYWRNLE